jgi:hypothetical protein
MDLFQNRKKAKLPLCTICNTKFTSVSEKHFLEFFNDINSEHNIRSIISPLELDIYIDELKVAFEINGIVHYNPIYGIEKYNKIIKRDLLKNKLTKDKGIILYTIKDESKKFSIKYAEEILEKIYKFIHKLHFKKVISKIKIEQNIKITQNINKSKI